MAKITRELLRGLRVDIDAALAEVGKKYGVKITAGSASFDPAGGSFTMKLGGVDCDADPDVQTKEAADFKRMAVLYGLKPEDLGRKFSTGNATYIVAGIKPKATAYPILGKQIGTDKMFKFPAGTVKACLAMSGV